jgi:hypothetical protein
MQQYNQEQTDTHVLTHTVIHKPALFNTRFVLAIKHAYCQLLQFVIVMV